MPQATNLVVKNGAATPIDKTFALITPAAGDGGVARWALKEGAISSVFPTFTAQSNATTNASRKLTTKLRVPSSYTDSVTGRTLVGSGAEANVTVSVPNDFPEALKNDFVAFVTNILTTALLKEMFRDATGAN